LKCDAGEGWRRSVGWRSEKVLQRVEEQRNNIQRVKRRKAYWTGHILGRNCLINHVIEGKTEGRIEVMERRGRRGKQLLDCLKERENTVNRKRKH
jgi:hypothetical protein